MVGSKTQEGGQAFSLVTSTLHIIIDTGIHSYTTSFKMSLLLPLLCMYSETTASNIYCKCSKWRHLTLLYVWLLVLSAPLQHASTYIHGCSIHAYMHWYTTHICTYTYNWVLKHVAPLHCYPELYMNIMLLSNVPIIRSSSLILVAFHHLCQEITTKTLTNLNLKCNHIFSWHGSIWLCMSYSESWCLLLMTC